MRLRLPAMRYAHEAVLVLALIALLGYAALYDRRFVTLATQQGLIGDMWEVATISVPMTLIIISGGIDLSLGSAMALASVLFGLASAAHWGAWGAAGAAIAAGAAAGALNGAFVAWVRVHPLLVTLATLAAFRGAAEGLSLGESFSGFPAAFTALDDNAAGAPLSAACYLLIALGAGILLARTPAGLAIHAIGHNETAARFSGLAVERVKFALYCAAGAVSGLCAVLYAARRHTAKADVGDGLELEAITAVVLGGTSIFGGSGRIAGTVLGTLLIHETRQFVSWHWERDELTGMVVGALLVIAVLIHSMTTRTTR
jgi:rhamnose transport system permease protein